LFDPKINTAFFKAFSSLASPREERGLASSTWYILSALLVLLFFPTNCALAGILVLAWADPAANVVGQRWGRAKFLGGTIRGSATFLVVAFLALILFVPWPQALAAAALTTLVEAAPIQLDDNLLVPLTAAASLFLMMG
jgi:dolichol kinase